MPRYSPIPDVPAIAVDPSLEAEPHPGAIPIDVVGAALQTVQQAEQGLQQPLQDPAPEGEDRPRPPKKKRAPRRDGQKHPGWNPEKPVCDGCRRLKYGCDGRDPCGRCERGKRDCSYEGMAKIKNPGRPRKDGTAPRPPKTRRLEAPMPETVADELRDLPTVLDVSPIVVADVDVKRRLRGDSEPPPVLPVLFTS